MIRATKRAEATTASGASDSVGTAVLGAGPAGLSAAYVLALRGLPGVVYEADVSVGGIAKTLRRGGYRFDLGGQVFSTKLAPVRRLWEGLLGEDLVCRPRLSRIYCGDGYLAYPPRARDLVARLGVSGSEAESRHLARQVRSYSAQKSPFDRMNRRAGRGTTLIEDCLCPRLGGGQMWEALHDVLVEAGIAVRLEHRCVALEHAENRVNRVVLQSNGNRLENRVASVLSSMPIGQLVACMQPRPDTEVLEAASKLRHRSMRVVVLMTDEQEPFPDSWIYLYDTDARASRVHNFGAWGREMVEPGANCVGVEYACTSAEDIWKMDDAQAIELAKRELAGIGLIDPTRVFDGVTVRVEKAYPMRDAEQTGAIAVIRDYLARFENLETFGRNGLHRDNTQDHSVWTAMLATGNLLDGSSYDVWDVDTDPDQLEPSTSLPDGDPLGPESAIYGRG